MLQTVIKLSGLMLAVLYTPVVLGSIIHEAQYVDAGAVVLFAAGWTTFIAIPRTIK